jgi:hypothetical protein
MILTVVVIILVGIIAYFNYLQGFLSATMSAIIAGVAASLALGWQETVAQQLKGKIPDVGNAFATVVIFAAAYGILRLISDKSVPGNIQLPLMVERAGAGLMGLIAAIFSVGIMVIAAQMLPFGASVLGYSRFEQGPDRAVQVPPVGGGVAMLDETVSGELKPDFLGPQTPGSGMLLPVDDIVVSFVSGLSNGVLSNDRPIGYVHPNWLDELEAQRLGLQSGSRHTAQNTPSSFQVNLIGASLRDSLNTADGDTEATRRGLSFKVDPVLRPKADQAIVVIRISVAGDAADDDHYFRFGLANIRLVAGSPDARKDYYPMGTLEKGGGLRVNRADDFMIANAGGDPIDLVFLVDRADVLKPTAPGAGGAAAGAGMAETGAEPAPSGRKRGQPAVAAFADGTFLEVKRNADFDLAAIPITSPQMVLASAVLRKKDLPPIAGESAVPELANGSSIFGGMEMLAADKAMVSANVPFKITVPRHDGSDAQVTIEGGSATLANNLFSKLDVSSGTALSDLGKGDFVVKRFAVTGNGRIIQVHAQVPPRNPKPWDWAAHLDQIQLLDSQQQTYACHGAAAKYLPGGIPSVVVLYDSANPIKSIPAAEGHPTDIWLFYIVPRGTEIAGLKVKNVLQPLTVSGQ